MLPVDQQFQSTFMFERFLKGFLAFRVMINENYPYNQAQSEYKHLLTFCVRRYVVIATKPVHQLQIRPIMHN